VLRTVESVEGEGGMLRVEGGAYRLKGRAPVHPVGGDEVVVETFLIDARQVSNAAYKAFVDATGHRMPYAWQAWGYPEDAGDLPVIWVSMEDAEAYARWAGKRLATVREWQAAARGREGRLYPSGNESPSEARAGENVTWLSPEEKFAHYLRETTAVGERTAWDPPGGLIHSFSNVRELTGTVGSGGGSAYLVGRAWTDDPRGKTLADVLSGPRVMPSPNVGFRCAKSVDLRLENQE
ncbi:MAG: SUMF1/EgtB/PvdO family nonheme iron enzyme, partial [Planctomycetota bacterium]|nr:SUMF1/EgtB/PvdO family nonheme iron enzyme [Planctomycetota bacterium]